MDAGLAQLSDAEREFVPRDLAPRAASEFDTGRIGRDPVGAARAGEDPVHRAHLSAVLLGSDAIKRLLHQHQIAGGEQRVSLAQERVGLAFVIGILPLAPPRGWQQFAVVERGFGAGGRAEQEFTFAQYVHARQWRRRCGRCRPAPGRVVAVFQTRRKIEQYLRLQIGAGPERSAEIAT